MHTPPLPPVFSQIEQNHKFKPEKSHFAGSKQTTWETTRRVGYRKPATRFNHPLPGQAARRKVQMDSEIAAPEEPVIGFGELRLVTHPRPVSANRLYLPAHDYPRALLIEEKVRRGCGQMSYAGVRLRPKRALLSCTARSRLLQPALILLRHTVHRGVSLHARTAGRRRSPPG
jgi:hypothetical protein